jgi:DNA-binding transcriptional LysR family regulator
MNFRQLEAFRAVMSHGTITQAAESMNISQPAVTRLIMDFEASLTISLFQRDRGRLKPTPEAHLLFRESDMAFSGLARLREAAMVMKEIRRGRIRMISETVYAQGLLPRIMAKYHQSHPDVHIELDIGPSARVADWIAETWYDLGMVVLPVSQTDINTHILRRQYAVCAVPKHHRLSREPIINLKELAKENLIAPIVNSPFRLLIDSALKRTAVDPNIRIEARSMYGICAFVEAGAGVALVEPCIKQDLVGSNIVFIPCDPEIYWDIAVVTPKARHLSLVCRHFLDFLLQE